MFIIWILYIYASGHNKWIGVLS